MAIASYTYTFSMLELRIQRNRLDYVAMDYVAMEYILVL